MYVCRNVILHADGYPDEAAGAEADGAEERIEGEGGQGTCSQLTMKLLTGRPRYGKIIMCPSTDCILGCLFAAERPGVDILGV